MRTVLVIVDMQPGFKASEYVVGNVITEVETSRQRGWPIVFVEYKGYPHTYESIIQASVGLPTEVVEKSTWSAAEAILGVCKKREWKPSIIRMAGVNTFECIADTTEDLVTQGVFVDVVKEACYDRVCNWHLLFPKHKNIRLRSQQNPCTKIQDFRETLSPEQTQVRKVCTKQARHGECRYAKEL